MRHQLANRSTESFLSTISALLAVALISGCSTPEQITVDGDSDSDVTVMDELSYVKEVDGEDYMLWNEDDAVKVGDSESEAITSSGQPSKSFRIRSLPDRFGEDFSAEGWEKGDDAFACILYRGESVLAMYTRENIDDDDVATALREYRDKYGTPTWKHDQFKSIQFHFWYTNDRMLMISTAIDVNDVRSLTIAIGVPQVMKHVGMDPDPDVVSNDINTAQQSLTEQKAAE